VVFILIFLIGLNFFSTNSHAQVSNEYFNDVSYQQDLYNQSYDLYLGKKQIHSQYNSITTEKELLDTIKTALTNREILLSSYLLHLRASMDTYKPISPDLTGQVQQQLLNHNLWLTNQSKQIDKIQNKIQLDDYNQTFFQRYIQIQTSMATSRIQNQINHQQSVVNQIKDLILQLKAEHRLDQQAQNWISQIDTNLQTCQLYLAEAYKETQTKQNTRKFNDFYPDAIDQISKSKQILTKIILDLQSLLKKFS